MAKTSWRSRLGVMSQEPLKLLMSLATLSHGTDCGIGLVMIHELTNTTIGVKIHIQSWCGDVVGMSFDWQPQILDRNLISRLI